MVRAEVDRSRQFSLQLILATVVCTVVTTVVIFAPGIHFAYRSAAGHAGLETAAGLIALLAAYLVSARFRLGGRRSDLVLAAALAMLASATIFFAVLPALAGAAPTATLSWARVAAETIGFSIFAWAAWSPPGKVLDADGASKRAVVAIVAVTAGSLALGALLAHGVAAPVDPTLAPEESSRPRIVGSPIVETAQLLAVAALGLAAVGFVRRASRDADPLFRWFSLAAVVGVFARIHYFLFPSLFSQWVHTGDGIRLVFYLLILVASIKEIAAYQPRLAQAAAFEERRRLARDLHDGLAQDLAFLTSGLKGLRDDPDDHAEIGALLDAAEHALSESRQAIGALNASPDEPLGIALSRMAGAVALRSGADVMLDVDPGVDVPLPVREAVLRITREALTNAVRHGGGDEYSVQLSVNGDLRVAVRDNGCGFHPADQGVGAGGLGLDSMRERAEEVGGTLRVDSRPGAGTTVEAVLPR